MTQDKGLQKTSESPTKHRTTRKLWLIYLYTSVGFILGNIVYQFLFRHLDPITVMNNSWYQMIGLWSGYVINWIYRG